MPTNGEPVTPETRARVLALFAERMGRNAIAREVGLPATRITTIAREVGHEFDRKDSELAVRARSIDLAVIRGDLAKAALVKAWDALEQIEAPAIMVQFETGHHYPETIDGITEQKWQPGGWREHTLDAPTFSDQRNLATIFGIMVSRANDLTRTVDANGSAESLAYVDGMKAALEVVQAHHLKNEPGTDPTEEPTNVSRESMLAELEGDTDDEIVDP